MNKTLAGPEPATAPDLGWKATAPAVSDLRILPDGVRAVFTTVEGSLCSAFSTCPGHEATA
jgi:hypothetical protein